MQEACGTVKGAGVPTQSTDRQQNLITLFLLAANLMTEELVARLAAAGFAHLRPSHGRVFENLDRHGTRLTELAERARMTHQSMSELVEGLVKAGYVMRQADPRDARAKLICLTPLGGRMLRVAVAEIASLEESVFGRKRRVGGAAALRQALQTAIESQFTAVGSPSRSTVATNARSNGRAARRP